MLQRFRDRFGTAGLIVAVVALVAALAGTAIAAGGLSGKQKKEVTKIAKKYAGKNGKDGAAGAPGAKGDNGNNGNNGNNGADGQSVEVVTAGAACAPNGGSSFKVGGVEKGKACNGKPGEEGPEGSPWTVGGVLPPGETETGTWGGQFPGGADVGMISIPIPLPSAPEGVFVGKNDPQKVKGESEGCPGFVDGVPAADPGKLCVYLTNEIGSLKEFENEPFPEVFFLNPQAPFAPGTAPEGAGLFFTCEATACTEFGSWAVTAPEAP